MSEPKPFKLPEAFITQLKEFTNGFHLVVINNEHEFETIAWYPTKVVEMGMLNYIDIQSSAVQEIIRQRAVDKELPDDTGDEA